MGMLSISDHQLPVTIKHLNVATRTEELSLNLIQFSFI
jgi:hypothetical protein